MPCFFFFTTSACKKMLLLLKLLFECIVMAVKRESGRREGKFIPDNFPHSSLSDFNCHGKHSLFFFFLCNIVGAKKFTVVKEKYLLVECIYADSLKRDVAFLNKGQKRENKSLQVVINFIRVGKEDFL